MNQPKIDGFIKLAPVCWPPNSDHIAAFCWQHRIMDKLKVLRSASEMKDGSKWIHVSLSRPDRMPEYWEMVKVKEYFLGEYVEAYMVFAKKEDHVNVHSYCLHLWSPLTEYNRMANLQNCINEVGF